MRDVTRANCSPQDSEETKYNGALLVAAQRVKQQFISFSIRFTAPVCNLDHNASRACNHNALRHFNFTTTRSVRVLSRTKEAFSIARSLQFRVSNRTEPYVMIAAKEFTLTTKMTQWDVAELRTTTSSLLNSCSLLESASWRSGCSSHDEKMGWCLRVNG